MSELLQFLSRNMGMIFIFCLFFGGSFSAFAHRWLERRHQRQMRAREQAFQLELLNKRTRIAELEGDAIKLLVADTALGEDFNRRLTEALERARRGDTKESSSASHADLGDDAELSADGAGRGAGNTRVRVRG